jgi:hypothetical protein
LLFGFLARREVVEVFEVPAGTVLETAIGSSSSEATVMTVVAEC